MYGQFSMLGQYFFYFFFFTYNDVFYSRYGCDSVQCLCARTRGGESRVCRLHSQGSSILPNSTDGPNGQTGRILETPGVGGVGPQTGTCVGDNTLSLFRELYDMMLLHLLSKFLKSRSQSNQKSKSYKASVQWQK